jgi:hypothetical protein
VKLPALSQPMEYGYDQIKKFDAAFKAKVALEALRGSDGAGEARSYTPRGSDHRMLAKPAANDHCRLIRLALASRHPSARIPVKLLVSPT